METRLLGKRPFGRTGREVTVLTLGGAGIGHLGQEEADRAIEIALKHGINMIDVAPSYGEAEVRLRPWLQRHKDRFFLAEKTLERTKDGARGQLHSSLERLGVKNVDLYQMHAVKDFTDLDRALGQGGALEAFKEAKETGLIKHIGLTGHEDVRVHMKALQMFDFDSLLLPVNAAALASPSPVNDFRPVLRIALDRGVGITIIKAISKGRWKGVKRYSTWYEPTDIQREIDMLVWFALSQKGVTTYSLAGDTRLWPLIIDAAQRFRKLDDIEQRNVIEYVRKGGYKPLFPE